LKQAITCPAAWIRHDTQTLDEALETLKSMDRIFPNFGRDDLAERRLLHRLWLKMPNARELAPEFLGRNGFPLPNAH
jgi:hypothetical protein